MLTHLKIDLAFDRNQRLTVVMKNHNKKVLPFPAPPEEPAASTIIVQIGSERFAIHYEIEDLPPVAPLLPWPEREKHPARSSSEAIRPVASTTQRS